MKTNNKADLMDALENLASFLEGAWIANGSIVIVSDDEKDAKLLRR